MAMRFKKMHGLGNDFVVLDGRTTPVEVTPALALALADRHRGVGYDQLVVLSASDDADLRMRFYNSDGSRAGACGNASRCIARLVMQETEKTTVMLQTDDRMLEGRDQGDGLTAVNMGKAKTGWQDIPLAREADTLALPIDGAPTATSMGNPHCTFFVDDAEAVALEDQGPEIEHHSLFPDRTNVQFASLAGENTVRMRVWERGAGVTQASGSSACATASAAFRKGLTGPEVAVVLDGGTLQIRIAEDGIWMTGPTAHVYDGVLSQSILEQV